uniref:Uncharacterized protein n=1 Tax=Prolemur simus TaxID=1328070 RepID=A0A8C8ZQF6_PROSS
VVITDRTENVKPWGFFIYHCATARKLTNAEKPFRNEKPATVTKIQHPENKSATETSVCSRTVNKNIIEKDLIPQHNPTICVLSSDYFFIIFFHVNNI